MRLTDLFRQSLSQVTRNKFHSICMILSVSIGTAVVLLVLTVSGNMKVLLYEQLERLGMSGGIVYPTKTGTEAGDRLTEEEVAVVTDRFKESARIIPVFLGYGSYQIKNWSGNAILCGINSTNLGLSDETLLYGRVFTEADKRNAANYVIIDCNFAKKLYSRENIVGKTLTLTMDGNTEFYEIIGIIEPQMQMVNQMAGFRIPPMVYLPFTTAQKLSRQEMIDQLLVEPAEQASAVANYLSVIHRQAESFTSENIGAIRTKVEQTLEISTNAITALGAVSLLVAGIGILSAMISGTTQRRHEIGILISLGATRRQILTEVLLESIELALFGGILGILIGSGTLVWTGSMLNMNIMPGILEISIAMVSVSVIGATFGLIPALRAANMNPIDSLTIPV